MTDRVLVLRRAPSTPPAVFRDAYTTGLGNDAFDEPADYRLEVESADDGEVADLKEDPDVAAVARPMPIRLIAPVIHPLSEHSSWGVAAIGATESGYTGAGCVVAVLDSGIDENHPAFSGIALVREDFTGSGLEDALGHGTHCAGTIFGRSVDGARIGIAPGVKTALIAKVLDANGGGSTEALVRAVQWAVNHGAHILSMSLGFDFPGLVDDLVKNGWPTDLATSYALTAYSDNERLFSAQAALLQAAEAYGFGGLIVAAAGNESRRSMRSDYAISVSLPAAVEGIVAVGAAQRTGGELLEIAPFSNSRPDLAAPGVDIVSAQAGGGVSSLSGTSMACPHVAGAAALWWESLHDPSEPARPSLVRSKLLGTADPSAFPRHIRRADRGLGLVTTPRMPQ